jgi:ribosomal protein S18
MPSRKRKSMKGGGYGFGGSILNQSAPNAGNAMWTPESGATINGPYGGDCSKDNYRGGNNMTGGSDDYKRGGNNPVGSVLGGRRRKSRKAKKTRRTKRRHTRRRRMMGGNPADYQSDVTLRAYQTNPAMIQHSPRTGYSFDGEGVAGTADTIPY